MRNDKEISKSSLKDKRFGDHFVDHYVCSSGYGRKKRPRIRYLEWIQGKVDFLLPQAECQSFTPRDIELEIMVEKALDRLSPKEREFIRYFYYDCFSYRKISQLLGKEKYKLEKIHKDAKEKLKQILKDFVEKRFRLASPKPDCIICQSPHRKKLEELIKKKKKTETWKKLIGVFKSTYSMDIKTPQILISHQKKHMA